MTTGNNHLLQKVTFEIGLTSQDGAFEIQNRISNAFRSGVLRELEKLFDRKSTPGVTISIDKIEINLGNLNSARLEEDIIAAFDRELDGFLATLSEEISRAETTSFTTAKKVNVRWSVPGNPHFEAAVTVSDNSVSHYEKVLQLLEYGIISGSGTAFESRIFSDLIHEVLEKHPEQFILFLKQNKHKPKIFQRLALNLSAPQLQYIVSLMGCGFSSELPRSVTELCAYLLDANVSVAGFSIRGTLSFTSPEKFIWWLFLLRYAGESFNRGASAPDPKIVTVKSGTAANSSHVKLLAEIIFIAERLSERSIVRTNGNRKTAEKFSDVFTEAIVLVQAGLNNSFAGEKSPDDRSPIQPEELQNKESSILSDSASLLQNTLFTLPDKTSPQSPLSPPASDDNVPGIDSGIYIGNAGLILLAPYFRRFFTNLGLLNGKEFASPEAAWKAIHLLQHACGFVREDGQEGWSEHELVFNKIICGIPISDPVPERMELTEMELSEVNELLKAVLANWTIMNRSSVFALQSTFLQKKGRLSKAGNDWELLIERDSAVEILIDKLPWGISMTKLPWNEYTIHTQW